MASTYKIKFIKTLFLLIACLLIIASCRNNDIESVNFTGNMQESDCLDNDATIRLIEDTTNSISTETEGSCEETQEIDSVRAYDWSKIDLKVDDYGNEFCLGIRVYAMFSGRYWCSVFNISYGEYQPYIGLKPGETTRVIRDLPSISSIFKYKIQPLLPNNDRKFVYFGCAIEEGDSPQYYLNGRLVDIEKNPIVRDGDCVVVALEQDKDSQFMCFYCSRCKIYYIGISDPCSCPRCDRDNYKMNQRFY